MKKLVRNTHQSPSQPGLKTATPTSTIFVMLYAPMSLLGLTKRISRRGKASYPKRHQRTGQKITGDLFGLMYVLLNIRDEVAPGSHLRAYVKKLRHDREQEMWIAEKVAKMSTVTGLIFVLAPNGGKFRP